MSGALQGPEHRPKLHERAYRVLLYAYPKSFREEYGDKMMQEYRTDYRGARRHGRQGAVEWWLNVLIRDLVRTAVEQRNEQGIQQLRMLTSTRAVIKVGSIAAVAAGVMMVLATTTSLARIPYIYARDYAQSPGLPMPLSVPLGISYPMYLGVLIAAGCASAFILGSSPLAILGLALSFVSAMASVVATYQEISTVAVYITMSTSGVMIAVQDVDNTLAALLWIQVITSIGSVLLLGIQCQRSRVLGEWNELPILICVMQTYPSAGLFFDLPTWSYLSANASVGSGWIVLGIVMWRRVTEQRARSSVASSV